MAFIGKWRRAGIINIVLCSAILISTFFLALEFLFSSPLISKHYQFYIDAFNLLLIILTALITTTIAIFSNQYMLRKIVTRTIGKHRLHLYHVMYQLFTLTLLIALTTNNIGVLWVAMEGATLTTVLLVSLYRTPEAIEAAWKYFILCIVGIALALFGTILLYSSASPLFTTNNSAILWSVLHKNAEILDPSMVKIAFVFLLIGYGSKIGLVPLHNWLPDAYSESPAPVSALLSGLLSTVALYALIRFKIIADLTLNTHLPGHLLMGFGLLSFLAAAILIRRQKNIKRMFGYSSIEHLGLMTFAFGLGGILATFSAIFYMLIHALVKSAIFVNIGNIINRNSTHEIRALISKQPMIGWGLLLTTFAVCGVPPFGIFTSELLLFIATAKNFPWLTLPLILGLIIAFAGLLSNIHPVVYGHSDQPQETFKGKNYFSVFPIIIHLTLALILGFYLPPSLAKLLKQAAIIVTGGV
jgi:hydrogenase-4 component F